MSGKKYIFDEDWDSNDMPLITDSDRRFADDIFNMIQQILDEDSKNLPEEWISEPALQQHYKTHCLRGRTNVRSRTSNVYYDFDSIDDYRNYEKEVSHKVLSTKNIVYSLLNVEKINRAFHKLFEGGTSVLFALSCGFKNNKGNVLVGFNSFASDKTTNYKGGNTINIIVLSAGNEKTISLYALDAHKVEDKYNGIVKNHSDNGLEVFFNND